MEFRVLGPVEVIRGGQAVAAGGARARAVLAMLLLNANRVVSADRLAGGVWPDLEPDRAAANLQVRLTELRRALRAAGEADRLVTRPPGYIFRVTASELDVLRFEQLAAAGRAALAGGDAVGAARLLDDALALWRRRSPTWATCRSRVRSGRAWRARAWTPSSRGWTHCWRAGGIKRRSPSSRT